MQTKIIFFQEMPLFQRAVFDSPFSMQGELKDVACFFYVTQGSMISYDKRGIHETQQKNAILKSCGRYVQRFQSEQEDQICEAIAIYLYPDLLKKIYRDEIPSFLKLDTAPEPRKLIGNQLIEQYMKNLAIYFEEPDTVDEELATLKLKELMLILLKSENHLGIRQLLSEVFTPTNIELRQAVENNLFNNLSVEQLAYICHMSLSTFKREFKKAFNSTPARYIKLRRLEEAAKLLRTTEDRITDIAYSLGFVDVSTFSANFQEKYGIAPSKYRLN